MDVLFKRHFELLGLTLIGPSPVGVVHLRLLDGLTVLYGANGAGKTTLLKALEHGLRGVKSGEGNAIVHLKVLSPEERLDWNYSYFLTDLVAAIGKCVQASLFDPDDVMTYLEGLTPTQWPLVEDFVSAESVADAVSSYLRIAIDGDHPFQPGCIEVERLGYLSLLATGEDTGEWSIFLSAPMTSRTAKTRTSLEKAADERSSTMLASHDRIDWPPSITDIFSNERPAWVPIPLLQMGSYRGSLANVVTESGGEAQRKTAEYLRRVLKRPRAADGEELYRDTIFSDVDGASVFLEPHARALALTATRYLDSLLLEAPPLELELNQAEDWIVGEIAAWMALDRESLKSVPIEALSEGQRRWAALAIQLAIRDHELEHRLRVIRASLPDDLHHHLQDATVLTEDWGGVALMDEPERGLHATAIEFLVKGIAMRSQTIVTSHSAQFLNRSDANLIHVKRDDDGRTTISPMSLAQSHDLENAARELGLRKSDLLSLVRCFLVVEGQRDVSVIETLLGDELRQLRTLIVPMHGSRNLLGVLDSQFVFEYTEAAVVVALDGTRSSLFDRVWGEALELVHAGERNKAKRLIERNRDQVAKEESMAFEFLARAIGSRKETRVAVFGFEEPDLIYYLPSEAFVPGFTWDAITSEYRDTRMHHGENIKEWLRRDKGANVSPTSFRKAAESMQSIPIPFTELLRTVESMLEDRR